MLLELIESKRGTKVLVDQKHVKTIATKYASIYKKVHEKITSKKKRLDNSERKLLEIELQYKNWLEKLSNDNKHLFELIKNASPVAAREVKTPNSIRMEIILDNNIKINTKSIKFFGLFPHTSTIYQNY